MAVVDRVRPPRRFSFITAANRGSQSCNGDQIVYPLLVLVLGIALIKAGLANASQPALAMTPAAILLAPQVQPFSLS
jgi:hypothetical protein